MPNKSLEQMFTFSLDCAYYYFYDKSTMAKVLTLTVWRAQANVNAGIVDCMFILMERAQDRQ